ncbi:MAG: Bro-N domain-containing protein [Sphingobacteriaceae bacterium]
MDLQIFDYEERQIRTVIDRNGDTLFVAKDVCDALGLSNTSRALERVPLEDKDNITLSNDVGRQQRMLVVTESGLYTLIFESQKEEAKKFKKWITGEVLPQLRKTGSYSFNKSMPLDVIEKETGAALRLASMFGLEGNQAKLSAMMAINKYYGVNVQELIGVTHLVSDVQETLLTPTEIGKQIGLSSQKCNLALRDLGFQKKIGDVWIVTDEGKKYSTLLDTTKKHSTGTPIQQIKWKSSVVELLKIRVAA